MALQFLVGGFVGVINIMIHALVTVGAVGIARSAGLRHTEWPRLHLMAVMVGTSAALMVAHTLEVFVWALAYRGRRRGAYRQRSSLFRLRELHHARLRRYHACAGVATDGANDRNERHPHVWLVNGRSVRGAAQDAGASRVDRRSRVQFCRSSIASCRRSRRMIWRWLLPMNPMMSSSCSRDSARDTVSSVSPR